MTDNTQPITASHENGQAELDHIWKRKEGADE